MVNLVIKDIFLQKNGLFILLPALAIYLFIGTSSTWISIVFCIAIIMDAFAKDENTSSHILLNALPYTRKEIVSSKYIGAFVFVSLVLITISIGHWIRYRDFIQLDQILLTIGIVLLFISFAFPFSYQFKSKYLLMTSGVVFVIYMVIANTFIVDLNDRIRNLVQTVLSLDNSQLYLIIILSVGLLYLLSWMVSVRIYSRKAF
ncbi:ABC-2 transporter permease [Gracilibacillus xinjiangensis]|uniref:ABC-2 transporter permease n=1 Tax=Gracilibacillus xinjiangensis TaxID=1193282 RepID=A0ABV8WPM4_9BACI